jgi:hypothetical protein
MAWLSLSRKVYIYTTIAHTGDEAAVAKHPLGRDETSSGKGYPQVGQSALSGKASARG